MTEMRRLIKLAEAKNLYDLKTGQRLDINPDDEEDAVEIAREDAQYRREEKIKGLIARAFHKLGIEVADPEFNRSISYDEEHDREARVMLEPTSLGWSLDALARLKQSGLAREYFIEHTRETIEIRFSVDPALDSAIS